VRGEREYPVSPLPAEEATVLFAARASAVDPTFELTPATEPIVARIAARLDGLPLALELAAARARTLTLTALEQRLERALDVLVVGARDLPPRQRTLRSTLDWSFDLLEPAAQSLLPRLAVFSGGFDLEAVEAIGGPDGAAALDALVEASLVRRRGDRFHLLETIREYALARLAATGAEDELRDDHVRHFLRVSETAWERILAGGDDETEGMRVLDAETENLRAALARALETGDAATHVRLALAQRWFWLARGRFAEGRAVFDAAVAAELEPLLHAAALNGAATFAIHQGDVAPAKEQWEEALALFRAHGEEGEAARCVAELGGVAVAEGDLDAAAARYEEAAVSFRELGQSLREGIALSNLAAIAFDRGDPALSIAYAERAVALQRELGDTSSLALSLANVAPAHLVLGELERGRALLRESIDLAQAYGYDLLLAHIVPVAAELAACDGEAALAARLAGASEAVFAAIGSSLPAGTEQAVARVLALVRDELGGQLDVLLAEGRSLSVDAALAASAHLVAERS
jgi:predicted ATPase